MGEAVLAPVAPPLIAAGPIGWAVLGLAAVGLTAATAILARKAAESFPRTPPGATQPCPTPPDTPEQIPGKPPGQPPAQTPELPEPPPIPPVGMGGQPDSTPYPKWTPENPEDTHPTHDEVEKARNEDSWDCDKIGRAIDVLVRDLRFRRWDMQRHGGGDARHFKAYKERQEDLRRLRKRARELGCPYNPEADNEINRGPKTPTPKY